MGLPHTCASILAVFLSLSAQSAINSRATVNAFFTEGGCDVDVAGTEQHCTMAENAGAPDVSMDSRMEDSQQTVVMEEALQQNQQESQQRSQEEMQESQQQSQEEMQESRQQSQEEMQESRQRSQEEMQDLQQQSQEEMQEPQQPPHQEPQEGANSPEATSKEGKREEEQEEEEWPPKFPTTLAEFGYHFNKDGQLRNIETREPFLFEVKKGRKAYNQAHYEALGEVITEVVYGLLETEGNLQRVFLPKNFKRSEPISFFFMSKDALSNPKKLMLLIHGSGVVRAGQWARRLIINDCLNSGTQLPFIKRAMTEGYGVMVLNTNRNYDEVDGKNVPIRENATPQEHAFYIWKNFVRKKAKAKKIYIVAHSFGGVVTVDLATEYFDDFQQRVNKIAFTDSVHSMEGQRIPWSTRKWLMKHAINWISSPDPLDVKQHSFTTGVERRSSGTRKHEETSWCSFNSIFRYFGSKS